jgi:hypothetical protein
LGPGHASTQTCSGKDDKDLHSEEEYSTGRGSRSADELRAALSSNRADWCA